MRADPGGPKTRKVKVRAHSRTIVAPDTERGMLDVLPTKKGEKPKVYRPPVAKQVVRKAAQQRRARQHETRDTKGTGDRLPEAKRQDVVNEALRKLALHTLKNQKGYGSGEYTPKDPMVRNLAKIGLLKTTGGQIAKGETYLAGDSAPILGVLDQTTRPLHAVAGGIDAAVHGKNVHHAITRGLENKDKTTFSKILKDLGAPKIVSGPGGFVLDILGDPTTYVTFGAASVARDAAKKAAEDAVERALKQGLDPDQARRFGERAAQQAARKAAGAPKGLDVKFAGKSVPGVTRATAPVGKAGRKASESRPGQVAKGVTSDFNPNITPNGTTKSQLDAATSAARTARGETQRGVYEAQQRAAALRKALGDDDAQVVHAIETGTINKLPSHLHAPARQLRDSYRHIRRLEKQAGVKGGTIRDSKGVKDYVPHYTNRSLEEKAPAEHASGGVGKRVISPDSSQSRKAGTLADKEAAAPGTYNQDAALGYLNRIAEGARSVGQATLNRRIAHEIGRPIKAGKAIAYDDATEGVFRLKGSDLTEVTDPKDLARLAKTGHLGNGGSYHIINRDLVKRAHAVSAPSGGRSQTGAIFDKATGAFKFIATQPNPAFHVRNFVGDTHNAYTAQSGFRMPGNMALAGRALRALKHREEAMRSGAAPKGGGGKIKLADGTTMSLADLADEAAKVGAIRSGFLNQEIPELLKAQGKGFKNVAKGNRAARGVKRFAQSREDLPRLSTYIEGRKLGMDAEEASRFSMGPHFDYANLTDVERKVRRFVPFYTFSARNIPYQAKVLLTKPGKVAAYEKLREEAAIAAGLPQNWADEQTPWDQRNVGIPIRVGGQVITVTTGDPIVDLNEFPTSFNPIKQGDEWMQKVASLVNPVFKDPVELWANYSFFFRDPVKRDNAPLVAAPDWVAKFPAWAKRSMHITQIVDKKTGKKVWAWDAKVNYVAHAVPGPTNTALQLTSSGTDQIGRDTKGKAVGALGVKATPYDPTSTKINRLYEDLHKAQVELAALSQQGIKGDHTNAERQALNAHVRQLEQQIYQLSQKRGDKILPTQGAPKRPRGGAGGIGGGLDGGFGGGLGGGL
jgi:hypothetical protein